MTRVQLFDADETFGDDYLYFYSTFLDRDRTRADLDRIEGTLDIGPGDRILDVPCGHGRIANALARDGYTVTGVDRSESFLGIARSAAHRDGVEVDYLLGDLRNLPVDGPYDAVVCWFTSFGYFEDDENRGVLGEFARVLRPGGRLGMEMIHHDGFVRRFSPAPVSSMVERGDDVMIDTTRFDPVTGRSVTDRIVHRDGKVRRSRHQVRLPTVPEFSEWLDAAGFSEAVFMGSELAPPTIDDVRMVVVAIR